MDWLKYIINVKNVVKSDVKQDVKPDVKPHLKTDVEVYMKAYLKTDSITEAVDAQIMRSLKASKILCYALSGVVGIKPMVLVNVYCSS